MLFKLNRCPGSKLCSPVVGVFLLALTLSGVAPISGKASPPRRLQDVEAGTIDDKVLKYHQALQRRPQPGFLFDRFYNSWLDSSSLAELETFLKSKAEASEQSGDRLLLALFYAKRGQDVRALEQFRQALANDPSSAETWYQKAVIEARTLDFETALSDLEKASNEDPKDETAIDIAMLRGKLLVRNRDIEGATEVWDKLVSSHPTDEALMEDLVELQIQEGLFEQAIDLSDKLIAATNDPYKQVMRRLRKGDILQRSGKKNKALEIYDSTLGKVGNETWLEREVIAQIERVFRREDDLLALREHYDALVKAEPQRIALRKGLAGLQFELGMVEPAIATMKEVIKLTPGDRRNREELIALLTRAEMKAEAIEQTQALVEQFPDDPELLLMLADLQMQNAAASEGEEEWAAARKSLQSFIDKSDSTEYAYLRVGRMLESNERYDWARETLETCVQQFPESNSAREALARFLYASGKADESRKGQIDEAIAIWKSIAEAGDRSEVVRIARILTSRKENNAAFELLSDRLEEFGNDVIFLGQLNSVAIDLQKFDQALPWALTEVRLCQTPGELENATPRALRIISKAEQVPQVIQNLKGQDDRNTALTCLLAGLLQENAQGTEADALLQTALDEFQAAEDLNSAQVEEAQMVTRQLVQLHRNRQDWESAAKTMKQLIELPGGRKSVYVRDLVSLLSRVGDSEETLRWIEEWKKLSPGSTAPWIQQARAFDTMGQYDNAIQSLRLATQKFPQEDALHGELANRYINSGQFDDAKRIYWQRYEDSEKLSDKIHWSEELGQLAVETGEIDSVVEQFEERHQNNPQSIEPLLSLAQIHRIADNYEERRVALLEATRLQEDSVPLLMEVARMEEQEGEWEKAIETLQRAAALDDSNRAERKIASLYITFGEAKRGFAKLVELAGGSEASAEDVELIADAIIKTADYEQAKEFLLSHIGRFPQDFRLQYQLAICQEELGEIQAAADRFFELLRIDEELARLGPAAGNSSPGFMRGQIEMIQGVFPQDAVRFLQIQEAREFSAYAYQSGGSSPYGYSPFAALGGSVTVYPESLDRCHTLSLAHLSMISESLDESELEELENDLRQIGYGAPGMLLSAQGIGSGLEATNLLDEYPENEALLAMAVMESMNEPASMEFLLKAYEALKDDFPVPAFSAAIMASIQDKQHLDKVNGLIDRLDRAEISKDMLVIAVAQQLAMEMSGQGLELDAELREKLTDLVIRWYPEVKQSQSGMGAMVIYLVTGSLKRGDDATGFVNLLQDQLKDTKGPVQNASAMTPFGGMGMGQSEMISMPSFPPQSLIEFPESIYETLELGSDEYSIGFYIGDSDEPMSLEWTASLKSAADKVEDPVLQVLLKTKSALLDVEQQGSDFDEALKQLQPTVEQAANSETPNADAIYLAGCLATTQRRFEDAVGWFEKLRSLPMRSDIRQRIDGHLVALATIGLDNLENEKYADVVASARAAVLRIRRGRLAPAQREALLTMMQTLGLDEEAEKMEQSLAQGNAGGFWNLFGGGSSSAQPVAAVPADRIRELADSGKTDAAVRLLEQQFKSICGPELQINSISYNEYELNEFGQQLKELGLTDEFLQALDPGDESTSSTRVAQAALAEELFGEKSKAIATYNRAIELNQKQPALHARKLALMLASDQSENFSKDFLNLRPRDSASIGQAIGSLVIEAVSEDWEQSLEIGKKIAELLKTAPADTEHDLSWTSYFLQAIAGEAYNQDVSLPSLYTLVESDGERDQTDSNAEDAEGSQTERDKKQQRQDQRYEVHQDLARAMLRIDSLASEAFTALLKVDEARNQVDTSSMVELAEQLVKQSIERESESKRPNSPSPNQMRQMMQYARVYMSGSGMENSLEAPSRTPAEFLAKHYSQLGAEGKSAIDRLASLSEDNSDANVSRRLLQNYRLYAAEESQMPTVIKELVKESVEGVRRVQERWQKTDSLLSHAVFVWHDRQASVDLTDVLFEFAAEAPGRPGQKELPDATETYFGYRLKQLSGDETKTWVDSYLSRCREILLGDEQVQAELKSKLAESQDVSSLGSKAQALYQYGTLLQGLMASDETMIFAVKHAVEWNLEDHLSNIDYMLSQKVNRALAGSIEDCVDFFEKTGFLEDLDTFDPLIVDKRNPRSIRAAAFQYYNRIDSEKRKALVKHFKDEVDPTFGRDVIILLLENENRNAPAAFLYDLIGSRMNLFEQLDKPKQLDFVLFVNGIIEAADLRTMELANSAISEAAKTARDKIAALASASNESKLEKLFNAKRMADIVESEYQFIDWASTLLASLDRSDTDEFMKAYEKCIRLANGAPNSSIRYSGDPLSAELLSGLFERDFDFDSLKIVLEVAREDTSTELFEGYQVENALSSLINIELQAPLDRHLAEQKPNAATIQAMNDFLRRLAETNSPPAAAILIPALSGWSDSLDTEPSEKLLEWARLESESGRHKEHATYLRIGFEIANHPIPDPVTRLPEPTWHQAALLKLIQDDELPRGLRLRLLMTLVQDPTLPAKIVFPAVQFVSESLLDRKTEVGDQYLSAVLPELFELEGESEFDKAAEDLASAWRQAQSNNSSNNYSYYMESSDRFVPLMIRLFKATDSTASVNLLLRNKSESLNSLGTIIALVEYGFPQQARNAFRQALSTQDEFEYPGQATGSYDETSGVEYSAGLMKEADGFVKLFTDDSEKLLAQIYLAALPDPPPTSGVENAFPSREQRLTKLAEEFLQADFRSKSKDELALIMLSLEAKSGKMVGSRLDEMVANMEPEQLIYIPYQQNTGNVDVLLAYLRYKIATNNLEAYAAKIKEVSKAVEESDDNNREWVVREFRQVLDSGLRNTLLNVLLEDDPEVIQQLINANQELTTAGVRPPVMEIDLMAHLVSGKIEQWVEANRKNQDVEDEEEAVEKANFGDIVSFVEELSEKDAEWKTIEKRSAILNELWKAAKMDLVSMGSGHFTSGVQQSCSGCRTVAYGLDLLEEKALIPDDKILELGVQLASEYSIDGELWRQIAKRQIKAGIFQQAAESMKKSIADAKDDMEQAIINRKVEYADALLQAGNKEEASKQLQGIDTSQLFGDNPARFQRLKSKLNPSEEK